MSVKDTNKPTRADILAPGDGPRVYDKEMIMELLLISATTYHKIIKPGVRGRVLLKSSRLYPGGPRRHTQDQYNTYIEYLNTEGAVGSEVLSRHRRIGG